MNEFIADIPKTVRDQASRLENLIETLSTCCQERGALFSKKFGLTRPASKPSFIFKPKTG